MRKLRACNTSPQRAEPEPASPVRRAFSSSYLHKMLRRAPERERRLEQQRREELASLEAGRVDRRGGISSFPWI